MKKWANNRLGRFLHRQPSPGVNSMKSPKENDARSQGSAYSRRVEEEIKIHRNKIVIHDLPDIAHYWSNKFMLPQFSVLGFRNSKELFAKTMVEFCQGTDGSCQFVSVGSGNCDIEIELAGEVSNNGFKNFQIECIDLNSEMLSRGIKLATEKGISERMVFTNTDINHWQAAGGYDLVLANQSLHHFLDLEILFDKIWHFLKPNGKFLTQDMIGRNGHMRWPETLEIIQTLWKELPATHRYNHMLARYEEEYENWDCSEQSFEGIRAQDILPLLVKKFGFELFAAWGGIIDVFIDRRFGPNFDKSGDWDRQFIDRVHHINQAKIMNGEIKPTQMIAVMTKLKSSSTVTAENLLPELSVRECNL